MKLRRGILSYFNYKVGEGDEVESFEHFALCNTLVTDMR